MFGSAVLEALIALAFLYLLLSVVCSTINEFIARLMKARHLTLIKGLEHLLVDSQLRQQLLDHPLVKVLGKEPTYIPSKTFAMALMDVIAPAGQTVASGSETTATTASTAPDSGQASTGEAAGADAKQSATGASQETTLGPPLGYEQVRQAIGNLPDTEVRRSLLVLVDSADQKIDAVQDALAEWFDGTMDRASDWYKNRSHWVLLVLALLVSFGLDADTLEMADALWRDTGLREGIVAAADGYVASYNEEGTTPQGQAQEDPAEALGHVTQALSNFEFTIGWDSFPSTLGGWLSKIVGLLLTTFAVSLGAPFWFDVANKVILMRDQSGSLPKKSSNAS